ncbi:hypothetical protein UQW94_19465 [Vibrio sp. PBL-C16]|uniref:hypothetical protein n=1 Tax=Vibrio sp. PBL-C16 TaxID=3104322 RepID=UPI002AB43C0D|nr:hypothetical protein [Vibrio sp. PBL-C16]MDY8150686.1 hypothetical protein [Vibrio sp. PBL-C16]
MNNEPFYDFDKDTIPSLEEYLKLFSSQIVNERMLSHDSAAKNLLLIGQLLRDSLANLNDYQDKISAQLPLPHVFIKAGLALLAAGTDKERKDAIKILTDGLGVTASNRRKAIASIKAFDEVEANKRGKKISQNEAFAATSKKLGISISVVSDAYYQHKELVKKYHSKLYSKIGYPDPSQINLEQTLQFPPIEDKYFKVKESIARYQKSDNLFPEMNLDKHYVYMTEVYSVLEKNIEYRVFESLDVASSQNKLDYSIQKYFTYHEEEVPQLKLYMDKIRLKLIASSPKQVIMNRNLDELEQIAGAKWPETENP